MTKSELTLKVDAFIETARKYIGYKSDLLGRTSFGERVGYDAVPWSGAFIDVIARESGLNVPSFVYTPAALAEFLRQGNISRVPQRGDIAIFNFASNTGPTASAFSQPHAGIVIDVRHLSTNGQFLTIEGNTTGSTSYQQFDGVHQKIRYVTDVVIFLRPAELKKTGPLQLLMKLWKKLTGSGLDKIEAAALNEAASAQEKINPGTLRTNTRNKQIELVQLALSQVTDLNGCERGKWDQVTVSAFARFQRNIGRTGAEAIGLPDLQTLKRLAHVTGLFQVD